MLSFWQMLQRVLISLLLGIIIGIERERAKKEAGIRTSMIVAVGSTLFTLAGISLPYIISPSEELVGEIIARNSGFLAILANIVVGIGFLGAGIILKTEERVHGLTTAAIIWVVAAIGMLVGIGLIKLAIITEIIIIILFYIFKKIELVEKIKNSNN